MDGSSLHRFVEALIQSRDGSAMHMVIEEVASASELSHFAYLHAARRARSHTAS